MLRKRNRAAGVSRRRFVQGMSGVAAALTTGALGCGSTEDAPVPPVITKGPLWGEIPPELDYVRLPANRQPFNMLEVHLYGGVSPWETFYVLPEHCDPKKGGPYAGQQWWMFQDGVERTVSSVFEKCGGGDRDLLMPWRLDAANKMVNLGPFIYPLRERPDLLKRMRVWTMQHDNLTHVGSVPLSLTGQRRGSVRAAALGAHLERFYQDRNPGVGGTPYSYTIYQRAADLEANTDAAAAIGLHRASARPLTIRLGPQIELFTQRLKRMVIDGHQDRVDELLRAYTERYRSRLGEHLRAPRLADYEYARSAVEHYDALQAVFDGATLTSGSHQTCGKEAWPDDTSVSYDLAVHLINHPNTPARYVCLVDGGLYPDKRGGGFDTHFDHVRWTASNTIYSMEQLVRVINEPGENDPNKIDLDRTMVLLNTEFGRTPYPQKNDPDFKGGVEFDHWGTNHWPYGYVVVGLGGPIDEERSGIIGAIGEDGYTSHHPITPGEHRAAMMLMMGAWPFSPESFSVASVGAANNELEAALWVREMVLGYKV